MSITFTCEHCHKEVKAPDDAAGRRGKCPFCNQSVYIPLPVSEDDVLDLAPIDEEEERRRQENILLLHQAEKELLKETGDKDEPTADDRANLSPEAVYHHIVNYCIDMANGRLDRANAATAKLRKLGYAAHQAVEDFQTGKALEPALDFIPKKVLQGFLTQLADSLRQV